MTNIQSITLKELEDINVSLAVRIKDLAKQLKTNEVSNVTVSYWIGVDVNTEGTMSIFADNGFDISESIEVSTNDRDRIYNILKTRENCTQNENVKYHSKQLPKSTWITAYFLSYMLVQLNWQSNGLVIRRFRVQVSISALARYNVLKYYVSHTTFLK